MEEQHYNTTSRIGFGGKTQVTIRNQKLQSRRFEFIYKCALISVLVIDFAYYVRYNSLIIILITFVSCAVICTFNTHEIPDHRHQKLRWQDAVEAFSPNQDLDSIFQSNRFWNPSLSTYTASRFISWCPYGLSGHAARFCSISVIWFIRLLRPYFIYRCCLSFSVLNVGAISRILRWIPFVWWWVGVSRVWPLVPWFFFCERIVDGWLMRKIRLGTCMLLLLLELNDALMIVSFFCVFFLSGILYGLILKLVLHC